MSATRAPWERPQLRSLQIPVVEELLAESYRRKAEMWAKAAGLTRREREARAAAAPADKGQP